MKHAGAASQYVFFLPGPQLDAIHAKYRVLTAISTLTCATLYRAHDLVPSDIEMLRRCNQVRCGVIFGSATILISSQTNICRVIDVFQNSLSACPHHLHDPPIALKYTLEFYLRDMVDREWHFSSSRPTPTTIAPLRDAASSCRLVAQILPRATYQFTGCLYAPRWDAYDCVCR